MGITSNKRFRGDNNTAANNDVGSFNKVYIDFSGAPIMTLVCFCLALLLAAIVFMIVRYSGLVIAIVLIGTILLSVVGLGVAVVTLICFGLKYLSDTRKRHLVNQEEIKWSKIIFVTENLIATRNRSTQEISVHNAQQVQEVHHHQLPQGRLAEHTTTDMPRFDELAFENKDNS